MNQKAQFNTNDVANNIQKQKFIEQQLLDMSRQDKNFQFKDLSPDMLKTIRKYLFVASGTWETKLTADCSLVIKKRIPTTNLMNIIAPMADQSNKNNPKEKSQIKGSKNPLSQHLQIDVNEANRKIQIKDPKSIRLNILDKNLQKQLSKDSSLIRLDIPKTKEQTLMTPQHLDM